MYELLTQELAAIPGFAFTPENQDWIIEMLCSQLEQISASEISEVIPNILKQVHEYINQLPAREESWPTAPQSTLITNEDQNHV